MARPAVIAVHIGAQGPQGAAGADGSADGEVMHLATVDISAAEINDCHNNPVEIIPAQGANTLIVVHSIVEDYTFVTTDYGAGGSVNFYYSGSTSDFICEEKAICGSFGSNAATFLTSGAGFDKDGIIEFSTSLSALANKAVVMRDSAGGGTPTDGSARIRSYYTVLDI